MPRVHKTVVRVSVREFRAGLAKVLRHAARERAAVQVGEFYLPRVEQRGVEGKEVPRVAGCMRGKIELPPDIRTAFSTEERWDGER
jgi:hypothetical protein